MTNIDQTPDTEAVVERAENAIELKEVEGLTQARIVFRRFLQHRAALVAVIVLALIVILAFSSEGLHLWGIEIRGWWKYDWIATNDKVVNDAKPTLTLWPFSLGEHPFGQDEIGRDMFARIMRGTQQSLMILFVVGILATVIGVVIGAIAGYFGRWIDNVLMRVTDVVIIIPAIVLTAVLGRTYGASGSFVLALVLGLVSWTSLARLLRGEVLAAREREYVDAARVAGASPWRIMFIHILPNTVGLVVVSATLLMSGTILTEAAISFLGFGVQPPDVSLGNIIFEYETAFQTRPWLFWWPGSLIVIIALAVNFIGDGLRDAFDPRQKRQLSRTARKEAAAAREQARARANA